MMFGISILIWFGIPIAMVFLGFLLYEDYEMTSVLLLFVGLGAFVIISAGVLVGQIGTMSIQAKSIAIQETLDASRLNGQLIDKYEDGKFLAQHKAFESISTMRDALEFNKELASKKFYNRIWIFDLFYNDAVNDTYFIR